LFCGKKYHRIERILSGRPIQHPATAQLAANAANGYLAVEPLFVFFLVLALPGLLCFVLVADGLKHFDREAFAVAGISVVVFPFALAQILPLLFPCAFSPEGVYGQSAWGQRRFVRWQDIASARRLRILHLQWLRIYPATDDCTIWVGPAKARDADFIREVQRFAPVGRPILNCLT
jgi:hypothetical protein